MKRILQTVFVLLLLCGCTNGKDRREDQEQQERLQTQIENQSLTVSETVPFQYDFTITHEETDNYTLTLRNFDVAMYDVKLLVMPLNGNGEVSSLGFDEQSCHVIPFQEAVDKGYYSSLSLTGSLSSLQDVLGIVIQWKDVSGVDTYQRYWEIDCSLYIDE